MDGKRIGSGRFEHFKEFCGGLAMVFANMATIESDVLIVKFEKDYITTALTYLSFEGILHVKQYEKMPFAEDCSVKKLISIYY